MTTAILLPLALYARLSRLLRIGQLAADRWRLHGSRAEGKLFFDMTDDSSADAASTADALQCAGRGDYIVQPGDCIESIAFENGYYWQTLWNLPENAALKNLRHPNVLLPGDRVTIPPIRLGKQACSCDARHQFRRLGVPAKLRLRFLDEKHQPRAGIAYVLRIDGQASSGTLDGDGSLNVPIPPNASTGSIQLQTRPDPETYPLELGHLDPDCSPTGIRGRLNNLGFSCSADGDWQGDVRGALARFQSVNHLEPTGRLDDPTRAALTKAHKS